MTTTAITPAIIKGEYFATSLIGSISIGSGFSIFTLAILFSFGEQGLRFMDPDATVMIHDVSSMEIGKVEEIKASADETERLNQKVYTMMARNCGKKDDYFLKIVHKRSHADWYLDAEECKKHGLANQLRVPKIKIDVSVDIVNENSSRDNVLQWDSLAMVDLITELEILFGVQFDILEIAEFNSVKNI